jgi:alkylresorcinol/alkylpyrone synthase
MNETIAHLASLATASPPHTLHQEDVAEAGRLLFEGRVRDVERMLAVYQHAGIDQRQSCMPLSWYLEDHSFSERNQLFLDHGVALMAEASDRCLDEAGLTYGEVDMIVSVSTSGIATPSLDARLMNERPFRRDVTRLPIFGLGCAGGVLGLARAAAMAQATPGSKILFLCVELCGLTFRRGDSSKSNFVATALFGDGAAAALLSTDLDGPALTHWGEHTWPDSLDVMGWDVGDDGLGVVFSRDIPSLVRSDMRAAADRFLSNCGQDLSNMDQLLCHPGGAKVLDALEESFDLAPQSLDHARETLRKHGNMSAVTVLFVLDRAMRIDPPGRWLLSSLGPGFSAGFLLMQS